MTYWDPNANCIADVEVGLFIKTVLGRKPGISHLLQDPRFSSLLPSFLSIVSSILSYNFLKSNVKSFRS